MAIWKSLATFLGGIFLLWNIGNADIRGFVHDSENGISGKNRPVKIYRDRVTGGIDTLFTTTNTNGRYLELESNFEPDMLPRDSGWVYVYFDTLGQRYEAKLEFIAGAINNLELHLDNPNKETKAFTISVPSVKEIAFTPPECTLKVFTYLYKNMSQPCISLVDTISSGSSTHPHYHDFFQNLEEQDSIYKHGDSGICYFRKTIRDTTWETALPFVIDTTWIGGMNLLNNHPPSIDTLYFPDTIYVFKDIGLEQILVPDSADSGQVINPGIIIRNYGTINQEPWLHCKINDFYYDSINVVAQPGIDTFYFSPCTLSQVGNWLVTSYSVLQGDVNPGNDTLQKTIVVNPVGVVEENQKESLESKFKIYPTVSSGNIFNTDYRGEVNIFDESGRKVGTSVIQDGKLNLVYLPAGVYFVKPENGDFKPEKVVKTE